MGRPVGDVGLSPCDGNPFDQRNVRLAPRPLELLAQIRYVTHRFAGACHAVADYMSHRSLHVGRFPACLPGDDQGEAEKRCGHHIDGPITRMAQVVGRLRGVAAAMLASAMAFA